MTPLLSPARRTFWFVVGAFVLAKAFSGYYLLAHDLHAMNTARLEGQK